ncbi:hypothetical protein AAC03nite_19970 [Alicyclobacillus acidoterrestris]|uniref:hypothetical protein n=1 Tax=Alicyclobacillus suci TaxID=2816080 RepID=UPI00118F43DC|nr:hypothetical protein [Alicyclobacillus suci]GEO26212.1 hypothetical protein AAC03nite_19970 [Alicyclobacillus acidoterrestris]
MLNKFPSVAVQLNGKPYSGVSVGDVTYVVWTLARDAGANLTHIAYGNVEIDGSKPSQVVDGTNTYIEWSAVPGLTAHKIAGGFNFTVAKKSAPAPKQAPKPAQPTIPNWQLYQNSGKPLPTTYPDQTSLYPPIQDQGVLNACTAFATLEGFASLRYRQGYPMVFYNPLAEWFQSRKLYGQEEFNNPNYEIDQNAGVMEDQALQVLIDDGVVPFSDNPWTVNEENWVQAYQEQPDPSWWQDIKLKFDEVYEIPWTADGSFLNDILDALAQKFIVFLSINVYQSFENPVNGVVQMPQAGETCLGSHEIVLTTANGQTQQVLCRNSWGLAWGIQFPEQYQGCAWVPFDYVKTYTTRIFVLKP